MRYKASFSPNSVIFSDNAANMLKAFTIPGFETLHEDELGENEYTAHMNADYSNLNVHLKCFAHSINLVVREGIKNCREVVKLLSKIHVLICHFL